MCEPPKGKITPEELHKWYLEAIKTIEPDSYNKDAVKPFDKLTEKQQAIDKFIAGKIHNVLKYNVEGLIKFHEEKIKSLISD